MFSLFSLNMIHFIALQVKMPEICWCRSSIAGTSTTFITQFRWSVRRCWLPCVVAAQEHMRSTALTRIQLRRRRPIRCSCRNASQKGWCCCFASLLLICSTCKYSLQYSTFVSIDLMGTMWSSHHLLQLPRKRMITLWQMLWTLVWFVMQWLATIVSRLYVSESE